MCQICYDFGGHEKHFCGDSHGSNFAAWCDLCLTEIASFLDPEGDSAGQLTFAFASSQGLEKPIYSLVQVSHRSEN